jgi:hypothetical protein
VTQVVVVDVRVPVVLVAVVSVGKVVLVVLTLVAGSPVGLVTLMREQINVTLPDQKHPAFLQLAQFPFPLRAAQSADIEVMVVGAMAFVVTADGVLTLVVVQTGGHFPLHSLTSSLPKACARWQDASHSHTSSEWAQVTLGVDTGVVMEVEVFVATIDGVDVSQIPKLASCGLVFPPRIHVPS